MNKPLRILSALTKKLILYFGRQPAEGIDQLKADTIKPIRHTGHGPRCIHTGNGTIISVRRDAE